MQHYELLYIIPVKFAGEELEKIQNKVKEIITKEEGQINYEEDFGKKKLAYKIKHNTQGFYFIVEFDAEPKQLQSLNNKLRLTAEVLRHMIIVKVKITPEERAKQAAIKAKKAQQAEQAEQSEESTSMSGQFNIENQLSDKKEEDKKTKEVSEKVEEVKEPVKAKKTTKKAPVEKVEVSEVKEEQVEEKAEEKPVKEETVKDDKQDEKERLADLDKKLDEIIDSNLF